MTHLYSPVMEFCIDATSTLFLSMLYIFKLSSSYYNYVNVMTGCCELNINRYTRENISHFLVSFVRGSVSKYIVDVSGDSFGS